MPLSARGARRWSPSTQTNARCSVWVTIGVLGLTGRMRATTLLERAQRIYQGGRIQAVDLPDGRRYRVQVGVFRTENQAESAAARLEADLGVQSFVFRDDS